MNFLFSLAYLLPVAGILHGPLAAEHDDQHRHQRSLRRGHVPGRVAPKTGLTRFSSEKVMQLQVIRACEYGQYQPGFEIKAILMSNEMQL